jgi:hypothetical protein
MRRATVEILLREGRLNSLRLPAAAMITVPPIAQRRDPCGTSATSLVQWLTNSGKRVSVFSEAFRMGQRTRGVCIHVGWLIE